MRIMGKNTRFYKSQNKYINGIRQTRIRFNFEGWINLVNHPPPPSSQGSLLSSFIFIHGAEAFSRLLQNVEDNRSIREFNFTRE